MISQEQIIEHVVARISDSLALSLKETLVSVTRRELSVALEDAMGEGEFYRQLNEEMRDGLKSIYKEISTASGEAQATELAASKPTDTQQLFSDATQQLDEIMQTVLEATESIMETAEKLQEQQEEAGAIIAALQVLPEAEGKLARLDELNSSLEHSLTDIITSLSFQDLTGQRLKKVISAITTIRESVFELYVSTGLMMKHREKAPEKNIEQIQQESRKEMDEIKQSELKGPTRGTSQTDVDDLLSSLGL